MEYNFQDYLNSPRPSKEILAYAFPFTGSSLLLNDLTSENVDFKTLQKFINFKESLFTGGEQSIDQIRNVDRERNLVAYDLRFMFHHQKDEYVLCFGWFLVRALFLAKFGSPRIQTVLSNMDVCHKNGYMCVTDLSYDQMTVCLWVLHCFQSERFDETNSFIPYEIMIKFEIKIESLCGYNLNWRQYK